MSAGGTPRDSTASISPLLAHSNPQPRLARIFIIGRSLLAFTARYVKNLYHRKGYNIDTACTYLIAG